MTQFPPPTHSMSPGMKPHRGTLILVLGILGFLVCFICGIFAWVMGSADLKEMDAGRMDPSGRSLTNAGRIIGIINIILVCVMILFYIVFFLFLGGLALFGAAAGSGGGSP